MYDYLIVGAGLFGSVFTYEMTKAGKACLVIDKRSHIGGNCYTYESEGINIHKYGAHIFRTDNKQIWDFINQFAEFNNFINSPLANYNGKLYNLPFNMNTFYQLWGCITPSEANTIIERQKAILSGRVPSNLEEQAISLVGMDVYEKLVKGYTEKQWGKLCCELPPSIIKRLPFRLVYDNNYYNDRFQGIPIGGYTQIFEKLLAKAEVKLETDFLKEVEKNLKLANKVVYTGEIDALMNYELGVLTYRGLRFETQILEIPNFQGNAVINYTDSETPHTRIIEHKHFEFGVQDKTVITYEYPSAFKIGDEPYYPLNDEANNALYIMYKELLNKTYPTILLGGRLGEYRYYDMQDSILSALRLAKLEKQAGEN